MNDNIIYTSQESAASLSFYALYTSETLGEKYKELLAPSKGSMSVSYGDNIENKFVAALTKTSVTSSQRILLERIGMALIDIEEQIEPEKLKISIHFGGSDGEIYIVRDYHSEGIAKLILNEDGLLAMSFVGNKDATRPHLIESFYDADELETKLDFPHLMYRFLSI